MTGVSDFPMIFLINYPSPWPKTNYRVIGHDSDELRLEIWCNPIGALDIIVLKKDTEEVIAQCQTRRLVLEGDGEHWALSFIRFDDKKSLIRWDIGRNSDADEGDEPIIITSSVRGAPDPSKFSRDDVGIRFAVRDRRNVIRQNGLLKDKELQERRWQDLRRHAKLLDDFLLRFREGDMAYIEAIAWMLRKLILSGSGNGSLLNCAALRNMPLLV